MNLKKLIILLLIGFVCSVSVVSAADINDSAIEKEFEDNHDSGNVIHCNFIHNHAQEGGSLRIESGNWYFTDNIAPSDCHSVFTWHECNATNSDLK